MPGISYNPCLGTFHILFLLSLLLAYSSLSQAAYASQAPFNYGHQQDLTLLKVTLLKVTLLLTLRCSCLMGPVSLRGMSSPINALPLTVPISRWALRRVCGCPLPAWPLASRCLRCPPPVSGCHHQVSRCHHLAWEASGCPLQALPCLKLSPCNPNAVVQTCLQSGATQGHLSNSMTRCGAILPHCSRNPPWIGACGRVGHLCPGHSL